MADQRRSERLRHLRRFGRGVVVVALLVLTACDPTGNLYPGGSGTTDPGLLGPWINKQVIPSGEDGNYTRIITKWVFDSTSSCLRETKTFDLAEGLERTDLRYCTYLVDGRILSLHYVGSADPVEYTYGFPTQHPDTLEIGGFLFARAP